MAFLIRYKVSVKFHKDFVEVSGDQIVVGIKSKPVEGRANRELLKKIAEYFDVPSSSISIVSGATSKKKIVEVENDK